MITLDSKIQKGEKEKEMKNKKLWIFGGIILLIVILNHIFDWSSHISTAENLEFMKRIVQNNLPLSIPYTIELPEEDYSALSAS